VPETAAEPQHDDEYDTNSDNDTKETADALAETGLA
jgi:hypothetical protein